MQDQLRVNFESCKRCAQVGLDFPALVPIPSNFATSFSDLQTLVVAGNNASGSLSTNTAAADQQLDVKSVHHEDLRGLLSKVAAAGRAAEPSNPGTQARFRYDRNLPELELIAAADQFLSATAADQTLLESWGAPTGWHADLAALKTNFASAVASKASAVGARAGAGASFADIVRQSMQLRRTLDNMVINYFDGQPDALAAWAVAFHIEKLPVKHRTPKTP